jgi:protein TonB
MTATTFPPLQQPPAWRWFLAAILVTAGHALLVIALIRPWQSLPIAAPAASAPILIDMLPMAMPVAAPPPLAEPIPDRVPDPLIELPSETPPMEKAEVAVPLRQVKPKPIKKIPDPPKATKPKQKPLEKPQDTPTPLQEGPQQQAATPTVSTQITEGAAVQQQQQITWQGLVMARLERLKRYPRAAQNRHQEGTATLAVTLDRNGKVLSARLEQDSGYPLLDQEAMTLIHRAQPLPAPPASISGQTISLLIPIRFFMR